ncbi:EVE domain-containing protein [Jiangella muralis]|uniref:EVE domain-containing protein n=1 Tax=Jiangella muralis TaxID=702383 RepID=UPI00069EC808|nr:EVE domain-containing protein [Jiangella muralis]
MFVENDDGVELNAAFTVTADRQQLCLVLESAGGKSARTAQPRNHEYVDALRLLLSRLRSRRAILEEALVASSRLIELPEGERRLITAPVALSGINDIERLRLEITAAQGRIGLPTGAKKEGNNRKRIMLRLAMPGYGPEDAQRLAADLATSHLPGPPHNASQRHWLLQCNPKIWDVWSWRESSTEPLDRWTVTKHLKDLRPGDRFAFWISGAGAGVYATGTLMSDAYVTTEFGDHWQSPPRESHVVDLRFDHYLFDRPLTKTSLVEFPEFTDSLIVRMPGTATRSRSLPESGHSWRATSASSRPQNRRSVPTSS